MIADDIIQKARYSLSDEDKTRWSDARLLSLLNECIYDIAIKTRLFHDDGFVVLDKNRAIYDVSSFATRINRIEYINCPLTKMTYNQMDCEFGCGWQQEVTDEGPTHIVYDLKNINEFRLYPIPNNTGEGVVTANSDYGIITDIDYTGIELQIVGEYGDINADDLKDYLRIYFVKCPDEIQDINQELDSVIDKTMISMIVHYIVGLALEDNADTQDMNVANVKLSHYDTKLQGYIAKDMSHRMLRTERQTSYNPMS